MQARLLLEDGTLFTGKAFGGAGESTGEVVFNTAMTGYQEVISNPSNCGQIVTMTYPLIGNYGMSRDDFEAVRPYIHGLVVKQHEEAPSNWRGQYTLDYFLKQYEVPGISDIDTRMLTRILSRHGSMKGILTTSNKSIGDLQEQLSAFEGFKDQVKRVSTKNVFHSPGSNERIVLVDLGAKSGILRELTKRGCDVVVVPYHTTATQIRMLFPDGILLSNGPGNPKDVPHVVETIAELLGEFPIFGICLGHQLLALACGADTSKLQHGHHRGNAPVKDLATNRCYITSQNHGYTVSESSLSQTALEVTHLNVNDGTVEGLKHRELPAFSVQYHPEASPGSFDSDYLFDEFLQMIHQFRADIPQVPLQMQFMKPQEGVVQIAQK